MDYPKLEFYSWGYQDLKLETSQALGGFSTINIDITITKTYQYWSYIQTFDGTTTIGIMNAIADQ